MAKPNIITGIDIGTSKIRIVVALAKEPDEKPKVIGVGEVLSTGMRKGVVVDIDEVTENLKKAVEQAELSSGVPINHAYVSIGGNHVNIRENTGVVAVSRADQEVSEEDITRVIDSASAISLPPNREIIHVIPRSFKLDEEKDIQDPLGMTGARLEVDTLIIDGLAPYLKNLTKCVSNIGIKVDDLVLDVLAASQSVLSKRQKELGALVLDLGGGTAGMAVYEEGKLLHIHILPVGSAHITNDIAIGLQTTIDLAEKIKLQYGSALPSEVKKNETIDLSELNESETGNYSRREVAKFIEARTQEIFDLVNRELKKIGRQKLLPAGVILVGRGSMMSGIVDVAKKELGLPAQMGFPSQVDSVIEQVNDPAFATTAGLILWAIQCKKEPRVVSPPIITVGKIRRWLRTFIP